MKYPLPFYESAKTEYNNDNDPVRKTFRLAILAEQLIKFHTAVIVQNFLQSTEVKAEGKAYLGRGLQRPSLGLWAFFTETIHPLIEKDDLYWRDFPEYFATILKPISAELIPFRNTLHHGPTPSLTTCTTYQEKIYPLILNLETSGVLGRERLVVGDFLSNSSTREIELISDEGRTLNLTPLLYYRESTEGVNESEKYFFYNDTRKSKDKTVNLLNYEIGLRETTDIYEEFRKTYPLEDWNTLQFARFQTRIDELTENFQGRTKELGEIQTFLKTGAGAYFVFGGPGMGKSSLLARAITLTLASMEEKTDYSEEKFELGLNLGVCDYFIRRNTNTSYASTFFQMVGDDLEGIFQTGIPIGNNVDEMKEKWSERLIKIESKLKEFKKENEKILKNKKDEKLKPTKLVIFIDGLDEGEEEIIRAIPGKAHEDILFLCSARDHVRQNLSHIDARMELFLGGLHPEEIAGLLRSLTLATQLNDNYLKDVIQKSGGSPLYLKMLSDAILRGELQAGDLSRLPGEAGKFYEEILDRMKKHPLGEKILETLLLITLARDFLTGDTIAYFLNTDRRTVDDYLATAREVLWMNPQTEDRLDYQLFHESLRDYIKDLYSNELQSIRKKFILPGIQNWEEIHILDIDPYTDEYLLKYGVTHFLEDKRTQKEAENLVLNPEFVEAQLKTLNFYKVPLNDANFVLRAIILELGGEPCTTRPLEEIFLPNTNPEEPFRTTRFVQLVNHTGELSHKASTDIGIAWKWVEEGKVAEALERLSPIQDKQRLFDCYLLALWLLTLQPDGEENRAGLKLVLEEVEKNIPPAESRTVKWHVRYSVEFFSNMCKTLLEREQKVNGVFDRGDDGQKKDVLLNCLGYEKIGDKYEQTKFEELRSHFNKFISKYIFLTRTIELSHDYIFLLITFVESIYRLGDIELGLRLFPDIIESTNYIINPIEKSKLLASILESFSLLFLSSNDKTLLINLVEIASGIKDPNFRDKARAIIVESLSLLSLSIKEISLFTKIKEIAGEIRDIVNRDKANSSIVEIFSLLSLTLNDTSLYPYLLDLARGVEDTNLRDRASNRLIDTFYILTISSNDRTLLRELASVSQQLKNSRYRSSSLSSIGKFINYLDDIEMDTVRIASRIESKQEVKNSQNNQEIIRNLCDFLKRLGNIELNNSNFLVLIAEKIEDSINHNESTDEIGYFDLAKNIFIESIERIDRTQNSINMVDLIKKFGKFLIITRNAELGRIFFPILIDLSRRIDDSRTRSKALMGIGEQLYDLGEVELALNLFQEIAVESFQFSELAELDIENVFDLNPTHNTVNESTEIIISIGESVNKFGVMMLKEDVFLDVLEVIRGIEDLVSRSSLLLRVGESIFKQGELNFGLNLIQEALNVIEDMEDSYSRFRSLNNVIDSIRILGDDDLVRSLFQEAIELARSVEDSDSFCRLLLSIGESISLWGDMELGSSLLHEAVDVARGIEDLASRSSLFLSIGEYMSKRGDLDLGFVFIKEAEEVARCIEDLDSRIFLLRSIGESLSYTGDVELGISIFSILVELARSIEISEFRSETIISIGDSVSELNNLILAQSIFPLLIDVARGIEESNYASEALNRIGESVSKMGDMELGRSLFLEAIDLAYEFKHTSNRIWLLRRIGESVSKIGDVELGSRLFHEAMDLACSEITRDSFSIIGISLSNLNNMEFVHSLFPLLVQHALSIEDSTIRVKTLLSLGESLSKLGDVVLGSSLFPLLVQHALSIEDSSDRRRTLLRLGESISNLGESDLSNKLLPQILELGYQLKITTEKIDVVKSIARATATFGSTTAYSFFENNHESHPDILEVVRAYAEDYRKINWEEPKSTDLFPYYIRSFGWVPYDGEFAKEGAYDVISTLAKLGKIEESLEAARGIGMIPRASTGGSESVEGEMD